MKSLLRLLALLILATYTSHKSDRETIGPATRDLADRRHSPGLVESHWA